MDRASATVLSVGSLAVDVFASTLERKFKLLKTIRKQNLTSGIGFRSCFTMSDLPQNNERCRLQLIIECNRILAWGHVVGLVTLSTSNESRVASKESRVASSLGINAVQLCGIVARIGALLGNFEDDFCNIDYLPPSDEKVGLDRTVSSLAQIYYTEGDNRIRAWYVQARWAAVDILPFEALLEDIHVLIERIPGLMSDEHKKQVLEITANTYREMVMARNDLHELRDLIEAITCMMKVSTAASAINVSHYEENNQTFRYLLLLKQIEHASNKIYLSITEDPELDVEGALKNYIDNNIEVSRYDGSTISDHLEWMTEISDATLDRSRPRGILFNNGKVHPVWIEWSPARAWNDGSLQDKESILRTAALAQMLSIANPHQLRLPTCVGYVDGRKEEYRRTGLIFEMPQGSQNGTLLRTLHSMLVLKESKPSLNQRISLARRLSICLSHLHAADWLHHRIHSGNVLFLYDEGKFDVEYPILSGFEYARTLDCHQRTGPGRDTKWLEYQWPPIQSEFPETFYCRKLHDIYSFGLLLLEIAHWRPLNELLSLKYPTQPDQACRVGGWLLGDEVSPPLKTVNPLMELREIAGDKYWNATRFCLSVSTGPNEYESLYNLPGPEIELQTAFTDNVVKELQSASS